VPLGGKINFTSAASANVYTITVNNTGTEFIYNGGILGTSSRSITIQPGETLELTSRGGSEWDVTGGTAGLRYQLIAPALGPSFAHKSSASVIYGQLIAYMGNGTGNTAGALYLATTTGSLTITGQALWVYFGSAPTSQTMNYTITTTATNIGSSPGTNARGDMVVATFTDITNSIFYRLTAQQTTVANTGNYSLFFEKLAQ
jgi:hypothetical protein